MSLPRWITVAFAAATLLLAGCGRDPGMLAPAPVRAKGLMSAQETVGLPGSYRPGRQYAGMPDAPSLIRPSFPRFSRTPQGTQSDPVNLLVSGSARQIAHVFRAQGWLTADPINAVTVARTIKAGLTNGEYPTSPMSTLLLYNRPQDMAWQKNPVSVRARDHLRVWETPLRDRHNRPFWAIAATRDVAIKYGPGDKLPTHQISPDIDAERRLVVDDFVKSGHVAMRYAVQVHPEGFRGVNGSGDEYFTDGRVEVLELVPLKE